MPTPEPNEPIPSPKPDIIRLPTPVETPQPDLPTGIPQPGPDIVQTPQPEEMPPGRPAEIPPAAD